MTISGRRTEELDIFCRITGFTSDFLFHSCGTYSVLSWSPSNISFDTYQVDNLSLKQSRDNVRLRVIQRCSRDGQQQIRRIVLNIQLNVIQKLTTTSIA